MAFDIVLMYTVNQDYIQESSWTPKNERETDIVAWMLYSVYDVLSRCCTACVHSWSWHGGIVRNDLTLYSAIMVQLWIRKWDGGCRFKWYGRYKSISHIRGTTGGIGIRRPQFCTLTHQIGCYTYCIRYGKLSCIYNSLQSHISKMHLRYWEPPGMSERM